VPDVTTEDNENPPNQPSILSSINGLICDIDINGGQMCGLQFSSQPALRRHIRNAHPGAVMNPLRATIRSNEVISGQNALKKFVLSQGWRNARYVYEPGSGPKNSLLNIYASACEEIAQRDEDFAQKFGTQFHRDTSLIISKKRPRSQTSQTSQSAQNPLLSMAKSKNKKGKEPIYTIADLHIDETSEEEMVETPENRRTVTPENAIDPLINLNPTENELEV
jgi:hypothetical protein